MESTSGGDRIPLPTNSLERALEMLELLQSRPLGLTHSELCRLLALPSSTCTYVTRKLSQRGYLRKEPVSGRFRIGLKTISLAYGALHSLGFRSIAEPVLHALTADTGLSAGIGVREGTSVLVVDFLEGPELVASIVRGQGRTRENREIGRQLPFHSTALGKVILSFLEDADREELIAHIVFKPHTPFTILTKDDLLAQVDTIRKQGYAISDGEHFPAIRAVAVPIFDRGKRVRAALSLNGALSAPVWQDEPAILEKVRAAAGQIAQRSRHFWL